MMERKELTMICLCCDELDVEEVLASRPSGGGGRPFGGGGGGGGGSRPALTPDEIKSKLDEKCPEFNCEDVDSLNVDCARFDDMVASGGAEGTGFRIRGNRKSFLFCGCCRD